MNNQVPKVLIVDDSAPVRRILTQTLTQDHYEIHTAVDGSDARQKIDDIQPDLVLIDVENPALDGFAVLRDVRANYSADQMAVIMVTSHSNGHAIARAFEEGAFDTIPKSATESEIKARVRIAIRAIRLLRDQITLRKEAEAASQTKSDFLANMSHEIRTPMTAILGYAEVLELEAKSHQVPEIFSESLKIIKRNGGHLTQLINDILDLSKIEAGKLDVESISCSPQKIVEEVLDLVQVRAEAKGLKLEARFQFPLPLTIQSDPTRIRQILINLIENAIKFTEVGTITLETSHVESGCQEPLIQFTVIDSGIGMSEAQLSKLFRPFTQADISTSRKYGGTGLGLTICKRLAGKLGGDILVSSEPNKGSRFCATIRTGSLTGAKGFEAFPQNSIDEVQQQEQAYAELPADDELILVGKTVLLAEDGPDNQKLIAFILKKAGAEVVLAENGEVAYQKAIEAMESRCLFDAILMDMQMPIMDGYEATQQIRKDGYSGHIIALTANAMEGDREKSISAGCNDHITKPIDRRKLVQMIASIPQFESSVH